MKMILIDTQENRLVKAVSTVEQAIQWANILIPLQDFKVLATGFEDEGAEKKKWSCFTLDDLKILYARATGNQYTRNDYPDLLGRVFAIAASMELDETPLAELEEQTGRTATVNEDFKMSEQQTPPDAPAEVTPKTTVPAANELAGGAPNTGGSVPGSGEKPMKRPGAGTVTGAIWEICDQLSQAQGGGQPPRKDVMAEGKAKGYQESTIATQYGKWRKFHGYTRAATAAAAPAAQSDPTQFQAETADAGQVPAEQ